MLLAVYVASLVFGGVLVGASAFGLGKDADAADGKGDIAHGADAPAFFAIFGSIRFWTFLLASFGAVGLIGSVAGVNPMLVLLAALIVGLAVGGTAGFVFRALAVNTVDSTLDTRTLAGREAEVLLPVGGGQTGKVRVHHQGQIIDLIAHCPQEQAWPRGARVLVVAVKAGVAEVTGLSAASTSKGE